MENVPYLVPLFFLTALVYSMTGLGGGSTYLALLALFAFPYERMPVAALLCNLIVVSGGCWFFIRAGHFSMRTILPFLLTSIPMAALGGSLPIGKTPFALLLGISLGIAAFRMFFAEKAIEGTRAPSWKSIWLVGLPAGALFGFVSGLVGIGGGIYLSPLLLILGWADSKQAAASASLFILVNSLAGLFGHFARGGLAVVDGSIGPLLIAVFLGGQIGSRLGSRKIPRLALQRITAVLILAVSGRIFLGLLQGGLP